MKIHFLITLGLFGALALASAQTIPNPSFEANSFNMGPGYIANNTQIVGWTTTDPGRAGLNPAGGSSPFADNGVIPKGTNVAFIQSYPNSSLSTIISNLTFGETYKVNFRVNARADPGTNSGPLTRNLKVAIDGVNLIYATVTNVDSEGSFTNQYQFFAFDFTAAGATPTMTLSNDASGDGTVLLDNFSIGLRNSGWSYAAWNDDASSGVVASNHYTHAYNFGSANGTTINGIAFTNIAVGNPSVPGSFSTTGLLNVSNNVANSVTGASALLASGFVYGGASQSITLYGLIPGKSYRTTLYSAGSENGARAATFSVGNDRLTVNQDQFGNGKGIWVSYFFTAASSSNTITCVPLQGSSQSFYTCGFCNCEVPPLQLVNPSFEADTYTNGPGYASGNFPITGWNGAGRYGVNPFLFGQPFLDNGAIPDGTKVAFIQGDSNGNGFLTQMVHGFTNGATYQVRYFENGRICCSSNVPFAEVRVGGQTVVAPHAVPPVGGSNPYRWVFSDPFVATNTSLELAFVKTDPQGGDNTLFIDNVSISLVTSNAAVFTLPADRVTINSARLNGQVSPQGSATTAWFQWGTDTNYGSLTAPQAVGSSWTTVSNLNAVLGGLQPINYHYRLVASNAFGTVAGADQVFTVPSFSLVSIPDLAGVQYSSVAWGDFDNDGLLDFLITGTTNGSPSGSISQLWRNTGSGFTNVAIPGLPGVVNGSVAWGDFDNDGRLDFLITGYDGANDISQLWWNTGSGFSNVTASLAPSLPGVESGSVAWGDFDNDGRLDFLITGYDSASDNDVAQLWRNTGSGFSDVTASVAPGLTGVEEASVAWGDFDNDGRLDFLLAGAHYNGSNNNYVAQLWRNTGSGFSNVTASVAPGLPGVQDAAVAWGDFDNDGRLDFLLAGYSSTGVVAQLWRNTGNRFSNVTASVAPGLPGADVPSVAWGDYDNDGRLDFLITGVSSTGVVSQLWRNTGSGFVNVPVAGLAGVYLGSVAWGDFDNDGRLDFLITGSSYNGSGVAQLWQSVVPLPNAPPAAPTGLSATFSNNTVRLNWNALADDHTPAAGLSYNVRIGTTPGGSDVVAPQALANGARLVPQIGNAGPGLSAFYQLAGGQIYYCSVQAVDTSFAGSPFAAEAQLTALPILEPIRLANGVFHFSFNNNLSGTWLVRATTNLALPVGSWDNLGFPSPLGGGLYEFDDALAPYYTKRFYVLQKQ